MGTRFRRNSCLRHRCMCAVAVASVLNGHVDGDSPVTVKLLGGDLQIFWNRQENLVYMTGPAATVFDGEIDVSFLK